MQTWRYSHCVPFFRTLRNLVVVKHKAPIRTQRLEKRIGRHHTNDGDNNAPAIGVPSSHISYKVEKLYKGIHRRGRLTQ